MNLCVRFIVQIHWYHFHNLGKQLLLFVGDGEEEEDDELEAESSDEDGEDMSMNEEPGNDSGCTAVVALLKGELNTYYNSVLPRNKFRHL